ncbi:MAG TPA: TIGR03435 family protein [Verrucomicrobiae bacterium]|nr:TIGR03435 family protein [Verrucomicrobiae bacterium]
MMNASKVLLASVIAVMVFGALAVKWIFFPAINESYFTMNVQAFRKVPFGLVVVRPTHFPKTARKGTMSDSVVVDGEPVRRLLGRNVTFKQLIAAAYGQTPVHVVLPADVPGTNFDFLVTVKGDLQQSLQVAIRKQLDYIAQVEQRDTEALALKVVNAELPAFTISADVKSSAKFNHGRFYFTHMRPGMLVDWFEENLKVPVADETGLTNFYDFSIDWSPQTQREINDEKTAPAVVKKFVNGWGLVLEPDPEPVEMLVVKRAT